MKSRAEMAEPKQEEDLRNIGGPKWTSRKSNMTGPDLVVPRTEAAKSIQAQLCTGSNKPMSAISKVNNAKPKRENDFRSSMEAA